MMDIKNMAQAKKEIPIEILEDRNVNAYLLSEQLQQNEKSFEKFVNEENQYIKMLKFMSQQKEIENKKMTKEQFEQALSDFKIEQEDEIEVRKAGFK